MFPAEQTDSLCFLDEKVNAHLPNYSTPKSSGIFSSQRFKLEFSSSALKKNFLLTKGMFARKRSRHQQQLRESAVLETLEKCEGASYIVLSHFRVVHTRLTHNAGLDAQTRVAHCMKYSIAVMALHAHTIVQVLKFEGLGDVKDFLLGHCFLFLCFSSPARVAFGRN